jgi:hypothetical protein
MSAYFISPRLVPIILLIASNLFMTALQALSLQEDQDMPLPFAPIALASHLLVATPPAVPSVDIRKTCESGAGTVADLMIGGTIQHDLEVCLKSEQDARHQIVKDWPTYSAAEKT